MTRPESLTRTPDGEPIETPELVADWDEAIRLLRRGGHRYTATNWMLLVPTIAGRMYMTPAEVLDRFDGCRCCGAGPRDLTSRTGEAALAEILARKERKR